MRRFLSRFFFFSFIFFLFLFFLFFLRENDVFRSFEAGPAAPSLWYERSSLQSFKPMYLYTLYHSIIIYTGCTARTADVSRRYFIRKDSRRRFAFPRYPSISSVFLGPTPGSTAVRSNCDSFSVNDASLRVESTLCYRAPMIARAFIRNPRDWSSSFFWFLLIRDKCIVTTLHRKLTSDDDLSTIELKETVR